jgi:hypothetical protein
MELTAFVAPIQPGKIGQWRQWVQEMNGPRRREYEESRQRHGFRERVYLQSTPQGDMVIVVLEGDHPMESFHQFANSNDPFAQWFKQNVRDIHGIDLVQITSQPMPQLVIDSQPGVGQQRKAA